jgi:hypothetical protein
MDDTTYRISTRLAHRRGRARNFFLAGLLEHPLPLAPDDLDVHRNVCLVRRFQYQLKLPRYSCSSGGQGRRRRRRGFNLEPVLGVGDESGVEDVSSS